MHGHRAQQLHTHVAHPDPIRFQAQLRMVPVQLRRGRFHRVYDPRRRLRDAGYSSFFGESGISPDFFNIADGTGIRQSGFAQQSSSFFGHRLHLMAGIANRSQPKAVEQFYKSVAWAAEFFAPHGLDVVIEPINARNVPGYFLNDFTFARDLITELKIPNLKLQFDIFHCQIIHGDVTMRLREMMPIIGHVQIASIPSRNEPDGEELNYPFLFAELDRLGYGGFVGCEYNPRAKTTDGLTWFKPYAGVKP